MGAAYDAIRNSVDSLTKSQCEGLSNLNYILSTYEEQNKKRIASSLLWNQAWQTQMPLYTLEHLVVQANSSDFEERSDGTYYQGKRVTNATIQIVGCIQRFGFDEQSAHVFYCVEVRIKDSVVRREVLAGKIRSVDWLIGIAGVSYDSSVKGNPYSKLIEHKIDDFSGSYRNIFYRTGWKEINGKLNYLLPCGFIKNDMEAEVRTPFSWSLARKEWYSEPNIPLLFNKVQMVTKDNGAGIMMFLYTQMSYLTTFYKIAEIPLKFVFALIGERGSMKTSLARAIALGCWDDPDKKMLSQFISTGPGIEREIDKSADRVFLLDDYKPTIERTQRNVLQSNLELTVRLFGDEVGKTRNIDFLSDDKEKFEYRVRGGCVITGEILDVSVESSIARMLICTINNNTVDVEALTWLQQNKKSLAAFQIQFLQYIFENQDEVLQYIHKRTEAIRMMYQKKYSNARYAEYLAQFCCILELLENFVEIKCGTRNLPFFEHARDCIMICIQENSNLLKGKGVEVQIAEALVWAITSGEYVIESYSKSVCAKGAKIYCDSDFIYFERMSIWEMIQSYGKKTGIHIPISSKSVLEQVMLEKGLVTKEFSEGRQTIGVKRPIKGEADGRRFVKIKRELLFKLSQEGEERNNEVIV